jgi:hypothetical protein
MAKKKVFKTGGIYDGDPNTGFLLGERLKNYKKSEITLIKNQYDKILENLEKEIGNTTNSIEKQKIIELENKKQLSKEDQFQKTNETKIILCCKIGVIQWLNFCAHLWICFASSLWGNITSTGYHFRIYFRLCHRFSHWCNCRCPASL